MEKETENRIEAMATRMRDLGYPEQVIIDMTGLPPPTVADEDEDEPGYPAVDEDAEEEIPAIEA